MMRRINAFLFALTVAATAPRAHADDFPGPQRIFSAPELKKTVSLGLTNYFTPPATMEVRCAYYPHFMAKEIDRAEEGDEQISFIPISGAQHEFPTCESSNEADEVVFDNDRLSGYFWGAAGGYAFLLAPDEDVGGGVEFVVVDPATAKIIADAVAYHGPAQARSIPGGVVFNFIAQAAPGCSIADAGAACAAAILRLTGDKVPMQLCLQPYRAAAAQARAACSGPGAAAWCKTNDAYDQKDPTVVNYPARMTILGRTAKIIATGPIIACLMSN